jgi:hypothetical protein
MEIVRLLILSKVCRVLKVTFAFSFLVVAASQAMGGGGGIDCPNALGECYVSCQEAEPTPDEACFTYCTCGFYECIGSPAPACSANLQ